MNLCPSKVIDYVASSDWDGYHQLVQNSKQSFDQWRALQDLKPNTKYYISCYVETFEDANNKDYCLNNPSVESIFGDSMIVNGVGRYQWLSTTKRLSVKNSHRTFNGQIFSHNSYQKITFSDFPP